MTILDKIKEIVSESLDLEKTIKDKTKNLSDLNYQMCLKLKNTFSSDSDWCFDNSINRYKNTFLNASVEITYGANLISFEIACEKNPYRKYFFMCNEEDFEKEMEKLKIVVYSINFFDLV